MNEKINRQPMDGKWSVVRASRIDAVAGLNGYLFLSFPISIVLAIAIGVVWASFVDKPGIRPDQSVLVAIPWMVPPICGLYLVALAAFFVYRVFRHKG